MSNLPPGVNAGMIPGNTPEDVAWDKLLDDIGADADAHAMTAEDAKIAWSIGLAAFKVAREHVDISWKEQIQIIQDRYK